MGMYCEVSVAAPGDLGLSFEPNPLVRLLQRGSANRVSLEKAWHGLHYMLTGEVWEGDGPLAFLLAGGENIGEDEESPVRRFTPEETTQIHLALSTVSDDLLWSRFDAAQMEELQIYPGIWDEAEDDLKEEYLDYFHQLKMIVAAAVQSGQGLLVSLG